MCVGGATLSTQRSRVGQVVRFSCNNAGILVPRGSVGGIAAGGCVIGSKEAAEEGGGEVGRLPTGGPSSGGPDDTTCVSLTPLGGVREALPIVFGYVPIGIAYGVLGVSAGVPGWAVVAMSVIVYAGSAQFIAVSLLGSGATAATIIVTTLLVNLRHILYSSALSPRLRRMGRGRLAWLAAELTDESFVVISQVVRRTGARGGGSSARLLPFGFVAGLQGTAQLAWVAGSAMGVAAAGVIGDPARLGLDYALVAMFLGLLALQLHGRREVAVALTGGGVALILRLLGMGTSAVIPATLLASAVGLLFVSKGRRRQAGPGNKETA